MQTTFPRPHAAGKSYRREPVALLVGLFLALTASTHGAPADLDPSFGAGGKVQASVGTEARAFASVLQPDGKIVVGGRARTNRNYPDFALARFLPNGNIDASFGTNGVVVTNLNRAFAPQDEIDALVLQPDGKIVAVGSARGTSGALIASAVVRYQANGAVDTTFGAGGIVFLDAAVDRAVILQADGRIVCAGGEGSAAEANFQLARLNPDGSLDGTFGAGGFVIIDFNGSGDGIWGLALQPDHKIVAVGQSRTAPSNGTSDNFAAARLLPNGSLDPAFGSGGKVTTDFGTLSDVAFAAVVQPDGKIVLSGRAVPQTNAFDFGLVRYNADGSLDSTFGNGGKLTTNFFNGVDAAYSVKLQSDGKVVAAGVRGGTFTAFGLARYNVNGSLDSTFGSGGITEIFFNGGDEARALLIQPDGKIVAAGTADGGASIGDFALVRYQGDLQLTQAVSRKIHGAVGAFDIDLPRSGPTGVECRNGSGNLSLILFFNSSIATAHATVASGIGTLTKEPIISGNSVTVNLSSVADAQTLTLALSNMRDTSSRTLPDLTIPLRVLLGDVSGNGLVNASDVGLTKSQSGAAVTNENFRADLTADGAIGASDIGLVKSRSGIAVP